MHTFSMHQGGHAGQIFITDKSVSTLLIIRGQEWGHTLISGYIVGKRSYFCYLACHGTTMAHRI